MSNLRDLIEASVDVINPVQTSAAGMDSAARLQEEVVIREKYPPGGSRQEEWSAFKRRKNGP